MFVKASEEQILEWASKSELKLFGKYLVSGRVHGKAGVPTAELVRIEKLLKKYFMPEDQYQLAKRLLKRPEYCARNLGTHLIAAGWPVHKDVETWIKSAADDEDWIVREYAAGGFAALLAKDFSHFSKLFTTWLKTESVNVKRAIALAVKYESKDAEIKKWKTYFSLINPLMGEEAEYIRKNLGPFAIGDGLLKRFPEEIIASCAKWSRSTNENVRWNTAMIFTAAAARKFGEDGKVILGPLLEDKSAFVSRAAKKALKNLT